MKITVKDITPTMPTICLKDLKPDTAFIKYNKLYFKPVYYDIADVKVPTNKIPVINLEEMYFTYWSDCTLVQPVSIEDISIEYSQYEEK